MSTMVMWPYTKHPSVQVDIPPSSLAVLATAVHPNNTMQNVRDECSFKSAVVVLSGHEQVCVMRR